MDKETFVEAWRDMAKEEAYTSKGMVDITIDEAVKPFLHACMKLQHNQKAVENLQGLIDSCAEKVASQPEVKIVKRYTRTKEGLDRRCT